MLKVFQLFYGAVVVGGISKWGSQRIPGPDLRSIQKGFKRVARSFRRVSGILAAAARADQELPEFARWKSDQMIAELNRSEEDLLEEERAVTAKYRSKEKGRIGNPAFTLLVKSLYAIYQRAGGKKRYTQDKDVYRYGGDAVEFMLAACEQIAPMLPESALPPRESWRNSVGETLKAIARVKRKQSQRTSKNTKVLTSK